MFLSLMKSLPMVARIEVLQRNIPEDWSVKDRTSCTENLHLGREDDIVKMVQMEGAKCIITRGPTGRRGDRIGPGRAWTHWPKTIGLVQFRGRFGPPFLAPEGSSTLSPWRRRHSQRREPFTPRGHPQARERGGRSLEEDRPTRRKHRQVKKKEDTVGSVTMISGAMSSTLMG
jgi:hypothetical protein